MPAGVGGWEVGRRWGEGRLEENVFVICWGWGQRGRRNLSRFPATDLGMRLGGLDLKKQKEGCGSVVSKLIALARIALGVVSGALQSWDKAKSWGTEVRRGKSVESTGKAAQGVLPQSCG